MPLQPEQVTLSMGTTTPLTREQLVEELKRRAEAVTEQIKRLEEAKFVSQETMQLEVSI